MFNSNKEETETVTDIDGNVYSTVKIGNQVWMAEDLRVTKFNDGSVILLVTDSIAWESISDSSNTTPGYCYYTKTTPEGTVGKAGVLYNWYAVHPANSKNIAPPGWHVPSDSEWDLLQNFLIANGYNWDETTSGNRIAKSMASKTAWDTCAKEGSIGCDVSKNNRSGFSAIPDCYRDTDGKFYEGNDGVQWWCATEADTTNAWYRGLCCCCEYIGRALRNKNCGFSLRLVRNN